jgi:redox-sensitive bicupin YhaK (pirin superfamily)
MRTIKRIHDAEYRPVGDLITYSPLPTGTLDQIDPFLFLNHHGPQTYPPNNRGLPFGPHPHRGMETVTFILDGEISHRDTGGSESVIKAGGVQWMTAGRGLIHAEVSSDHFRKQGGTVEILQLWLNLPARLKMTDPFYKGLQKEEIPKLTLDGGKIGFDFGSVGERGRCLPTAHGRPPEHDLLPAGGQARPPCSCRVNGTGAKTRQLVEFNNDAEELLVEAAAESILLFGHARPLNEPVVAHGPFVMNTEQEIREAYNDYRQRKFGTWQ